MNALQLCPWQFSLRCYGWGATSENISKIGDFAPTRSLWSKIDSFHKKNLCSKRSAFLIEIGRFAFLRPPLGGLGATYDDHLRLIAKRVVDFLLALIELFSLGVTAEALRAIIGSKSAILLQRGPVDPKFQVEGVVPHQPFFFLVN